LKAVDGTRIFPRANVEPCGQTKGERDGGGRVRKKGWKKKTEEEKGWAGRRLPKDSNEKHGRTREKLTFQKGEGKRERNA